VGTISAQVSEEGTHEVPNYAFLIFDKKRNGFRIVPISAHVKFEKQVVSNAQINEAILENPSAPVAIPKKASALTAFRSAIRKQFNSDKLAKT
jgi:hypothetical protein